MKKKYMVAVCDILGFKRTVLNNPLDSVISNTLGWFRRSLDHCIRKQEFSQSAPSFDTTNTNQYVAISLFSDTVMLYTREDTEEHRRELITTVGWLIYETLHTNQSRVRAGIAYGEAFIDDANRLYVGRPIIEAFELEKAQLWAGGAIAASAEAVLPAIPETGEYPELWIVPYPVPLKDNHPPVRLAINWTFAPHLEALTRWSKDLEQPTDQDWLIKPDVCWKWRNTAEFHRKVCKQCQ